MNNTEKLHSFGTVEKASEDNGVFEFLITDGFSGSVNDTIELGNICKEIAYEYPKLKRFVSDKNYFRLILSKSVNP